MNVVAPAFGLPDVGVSPRDIGVATFALPPCLEDVPCAGITVAVVPVGNGASHRPGARSGPSHIRGASRLLRSVDLVGADVVESAPDHDHAQMTAVAAAHAAHETSSAVSPDDPASAQ